MPSEQVIRAGSLRATLRGIHERFVSGDADESYLSATALSPVIAQSWQRSLACGVNPDRAVMVAGHRVLCTGAFADVYLGWGGVVVEVGKPDPAVYGPALDLLGNPPRARVLAVGDTPHTDLAGAKAAGLDSLWALTGLTADAHGDDPDTGVLARIAEEEGVAPVGLLRTLRW